MRASKNVTPVEHPVRYVSSLSPLAERLTAQFIARLEADSAALSAQEAK